MNEPDAVPTERDESVPSEPPPRFLQFRLSSIFVLTFLVAVACTLLFSMPPMPGLLLLLVFSVVLPAVLTIIIVYGRGYRRAFCIGAMFPAVLTLLPLAVLSAILFIEPNGFDFYQSRLTEDTNWLWFRVYVGSFWILSVMVGLICVGVRRLVEERPKRR